MSVLPSSLQELDPRARWAIIGAAVLGALGAVAGLVLGLLAYPPTAWAAIVEVGLPAACLGAILGVVIGSVARASHRRQ